MWTTVVLLSSLSVTPGQTDLSLTHVRSTPGLLGPQRGSEAVSPGDILFVAFDIEGISVDDQGMVRYSTGLEVTEPSGKVLFRAPDKSEAKISLGGNRVPAYAQISVGMDTPPGDYGYKITVKDLLSGKSKSIARSAKVAAKSFALVRTSLSVDLDGAYPAIVYGAGQGIWVHTNAVGFARGGDDAKQPHLAFTLRVLDQRGEPIYDKPLTNAIKKDVPEKAPVIPMAFPLSLNRPGKFTVELQADDEISGRVAKTTFPITVHAVPQGQ